MLVTAVLTQTR